MVPMEKENVKVLPTWYVGTYKTFSLIDWYAWRNNGIFSNWIECIWLIDEEIPLFTVHDVFPVKTDILWDWRAAYCTNEAPERQIF